jgi:carboxymethylenebutenolidase
MTKEDSLTLVEHRRAMDFETTMRSLVDAIDLSAVRGGVEAGVCFYGGRTEEFLGEAGSLNGPLLMHLGSLDEFISPVARSSIQSRLEPLGAKIHIYPGCSHAFATSRAPLRCGSRSDGHESHGGVPAHSSRCRLSLW